MVGPALERVHLEPLPPLPRRSGRKHQNDRACNESDEDAEPHADPPLVTHSVAERYLPQTTQV
jgi:hypothetical protein